MAQGSIRDRQQLEPLTTDEEDDSDQNYTLYFGVTFGLPLVLKNWVLIGFIFEKQ